MREDRPLTAAATPKAGGLLFITPGQQHRGIARPGHGRQPAVPHDYLRDRARILLPRPGGRAAQPSAVTRRPSTGWIATPPRSRFARSRSLGRSACWSPAAPPSAAMASASARATATSTWSSRCCRRSVPSAPQPDRGRGARLPGRRRRPGGEEHDVPVDWIVTPDPLPARPGQRPAPGRVRWELLDGSPLLSVPPMQELASPPRQPRLTADPPQRSCQERRHDQHSPRPVPAEAPPGVESHGIDLIPAIRAPRQAARPVRHVARRQPERLLRRQRRGRDLDGAVLRPVAPRDHRRQPCVPRGRVRQHAGPAHWHVDLRGVPRLLRAERRAVPCLLQLGDLHRLRGIRARACRAGGAGDLLPRRGRGVHLAQGHFDPRGLRHPGRAAAARPPGDPPYAATAGLAVDRPVHRDGDPGRAEGPPRAPRPRLRLGAGHLGDRAGRLGRRAVVGEHGQRLLALPG